MDSNTQLEAKDRLLAGERLRLLAIGHYIYGAVGVVTVSFLLIHFALFSAVSFIPESAWSAPSNRSQQSQKSSEGTESHPKVSKVEPAPPMWIFRIFAGFIGLIILAGWTLGGLTIYAGRCVALRKHRTFIFVMAAINCLFIPYGTILGIATFLSMNSAAALAEFPDGHARAVTPPQSQS